MKIGARTTTRGTNIMFCPHCGGESLYIEGVGYKEGNAQITFGCRGGADHRWQYLLSERGDSMVFDINLFGRIQG